LIGRLLKNQAKAVFSNSVRLAASKVLSLRISRIGGGRYLGGIIMSEVRGKGRVAYRR
jgi:hypothetical protein